MYSLEDDDIYIRNLDHIKHILADNKGVFCCPSNKTCAYYAFISTMHANFVLYSFRVKSVGISFLAALFLYVTSLYYSMLPLLCGICVFSRKYDLSVILI